MNVAKPSDLDLMLLADGELEPVRAQEVKAAVARDPVLKAKLEALGQVGEGVRTYLELETDQAEADLPEFADMWANVERRISTGGPAAAPVVAPRRAPTESPAGLWGSLRGWLSGHRGHVLSGLVSAGAVAALMIWLRPPERIVERTTVQAAPIGPAMASHVPCAPTPTPTPTPSAAPEVEDFEVYDGSGTVFTLPGEGEDDTAATVLWIDTNQDTVEGPI